MKVIFDGKFIYEMGAVQLFHLWPRIKWGDSGSNMYQSTFPSRKNKKKKKQRTVNETMINPKFENVYTVLNLEHLL